jgi:hypothetical protein
MTTPYQKYKMLIPVVVMGALALLTCISALGAFVLTMQHYYGFVAIGLCTVSFLKFRRFYKYVLVTTLILGLLNIINFIPELSTASFRVGSLNINFQPVSFFICILTIVLKMPKKEELQIVATEEISVNKQKQYDEDISKFKNIYANKSSADLSEIIADSRFTLAAKDAAQQILGERQE